jgi:6-phosphogluconolactonase
MTMRVRAILMLMAALAMMGLAGCGHYTCSAEFGASTCSGGPTPPGGNTTAAFVYAVDPAGTIDGLTLNTSAATFTTTPNYTGPTGLPQDTPGQGMVVAQGQYLYALYGGVGEIYGFTIGSTGALTPMTNSPFSAAYLIDSTVGGAQAMITNPAGTLLFVIDQSAGAVYTYQIGTGGALTLAANTPTFLPFEPENMATDGLGNFLYVTEIGTQVVPELAAYSITSSTGALTAVNGSPFSFGSFGMEQVQGEPSGLYLIGTTGSVTGDPHLYVFDIAQLGTANAGAVTLASGSPFATPTGSSPVAIAVQPSAGGNIVYSFSVNISGTSYNPIEGYLLSTSGALSVASNSPFTTLSSTGGWGQFDQSGAYLFVFDSTTGLLSPFDVGTGGALTQPITTGAAISGFWSPTDPN